MSITSSDWRDTILDHFRPEIAATTRITIAADPDELLVEQGVLSRLREAGFELVPFDDPVAFRFLYERRFREVWDRGEPTRLVVVLRTNGVDVERLPYDLLQEARREHRVLRFNIAELFPALVPSVVRSVDRRWFDAIHAATVQHAPNALGERQTRDFLLRHVFDVTPEHIKTPEQFLRYLLQRHHRQTVVPEAIDGYLIERLIQSGRWQDWPLTSIVPNREAFFAFLQERWPWFLAKKVATAKPPGVAEPSAEYGLHVPGPVDLPFEHEDVRVYIDSLFIEGLLIPIVPPLGLAPGWWMVGTLREDTRESQRARFGRLTTTVGEGIPGPHADRLAWLEFAPRFAEWLSLRWRLGLPDAAGASVSDLHARVESTFSEWIKAHYAALSNLPYLPLPTMVHQIPQFLRHKLGRNTRRALLVVDGLAIDQWTVLRDGLDGRHGGSFVLEEHAVFGWVPTLTSVSRQAIFAGLPPFYFASSIGSTYREKEHWQRVWAEAGLAGPAVGYVCHGYDTAWPGFVAEVRDLVQNPRCRALGVVVNTVDRTMHGMELGSAGMHAMVRHWAGQGEMRGLLDLLLDAGFEVFLTADHGNIEAVGVGKPNVGVTAETRGERVHVFDSALLRDQLAAKVPGSNPWSGAGLPDDYHALLAPGRSAFVKEGVVTVAHGGISVEEVIVPFVRIRRSA